MMAANGGLIAKKSGDSVAADPQSKSIISIDHKTEGFSSVLEAEANQTRPKSSPEPQVQKIRKIPRLRPRTAVSSGGSGPKLDQNKPKIPADKSRQKSETSLPTKKNEADGENGTPETVKEGKVPKNKPASRSSDVKTNENVEGIKPKNSGAEIDSVSGGTVSKKSSKKRISQMKSDTSSVLSKKNSTGGTNQITKNKNPGIEQLKKKVTIDNIKAALKEDFSTLTPLYQTEIKKITDVWVNTIYGSLTMRSHLVKLLVDVFPNINTAQFQTEDERLLKCIAQAKAYTEKETENLVQFVKSLVKSQKLAKDESEIILEQKKIAELHSNDWQTLTKKLTELSEETKKLQMAIPEEEKKKGMYEKKMSEKIRETETALAKKEEEINKLVNQLTVMKQKELNFRGSAALKSEELNDMKADIESLKSIQDEYQELKTTYVGQNEMYKKKIDALESLLEEKKKTLEVEKEKKKQLQNILGQLQLQQQRLRMSIGSEQVDYIMGQPPSGRERSRQQLWVAAVKLVIRGFLAQMKKLEYDKNKMLLELQSNDLENFKNTAATIVRKDHFMKSIVSQMIEFHKSCNYPNADNSENTSLEKT